MLSRARASALVFVISLLAPAPLRAAQAAPVPVTEGAPATSAPAAGAMPSPPATSPGAPATTPPAPSPPVPVEPAPPPPTAPAPAASGAGDAASRRTPRGESNEHRHRRKRRPGVHEHDGFYARFGLGFSGFGDTVASETVTGDSFRDQGLVTGFATVGEVAFGGTIKNGFVLGGGLYTATVQTPFVFEGRGRPLPSEFRRPDSFSLLGIMGDFYPNPLRGFHLQAALGLAGLTGLNPGGDVWNDRHIAVGGGAMFGIGYDWWVGEQWSVGVLGRGTVGALTEDDAVGARWFHFAAAWPSILFSATYH